MVGRLLAVVFISLDSIRECNVIHGYSEESVLKKYMCVICGFIYDEAAGLPEEGIPPGTRWDDLPINWACPDCGARKEDFDMVEI